MTGPILIVDDEMPIRRLLRVALERSGYATVEADCAKAALAALARTPPQLALLDLGLPDRDGLELIGSFREKAVPVIVLTAREASTEKVTALDLGADDYVTKPFDTEELLARIRSCLRRADQSKGRQRKLSVGPVRIDLDAHAVWKGGVEVKLTPKEFTLLAALASHPGRFLPTPTCCARSGARPIPITSNTCGLPCARCARNLKMMQPDRPLSEMNPGSDTGFRRQRRSRPAIHEAEAMGNWILLR